MAIENRTTPWNDHYYSEVEAYIKENLVVEKGTGANSAIIGSGNTSSGRQSMAVGTDNSSIGNNSISVGVGNESRGPGAVTTGANNTAEGTGSMANGYDCVSYGNYSHAEGIRTETSNPGEHATGMYNISHNDTISSIGVGTEGHACNAVEVTTDGRVFIKGLGGYDGTSISGGTKDLLTVITEASQTGGESVIEPITTHELGEICIINTPNN